MSEIIDPLRRVVFDAYAAAYDAIRPSYPEAAIDDIMERSNAVDSVEIGAGTGKATVQFARCGEAVTPESEMLASMLRVFESKVMRPC